MGARSARQRAANRSARKRTSASPAPTDGNMSASLGEERTVPTCKPQGAHKNTPAEIEPAPTGPTGTQMTQGVDKNLLAEDKQDFPETVPENNTEGIPKLPERRAREGFTALLARIAEEPEFNEADRSIGDYEFHDEEWESWKTGPEEHKDEYDLWSDSDSDGDQSVATATTSTRLMKQPLRQGSKPPTTATSKTKATRGSKRKHQDLDSDGDTVTNSDSESEVEDFTYQVDISSKTKDIRKVITQSSTAKWADFEETIAKILNIFTSNLRAQYVLSTEPTSTIPIALASENDLAELHTRLIPLVVPPRNANGSKSKRKMKEVTVKVTDKSDDTSSSKASSSGNGKKNENQKLSSGSLTSSFSDIYQKRLTIREALRARWRCETHTVGDRTVPCWRDGITTQCYVMTENNINMWADMHIKNPTTVSIDTKPPQINLYNSVRHARGSQDRHQQQPQMMPMGFPPMMGAPSPFYSNSFMNPWSIQQATMMGQGLAGFGANNGLNPQVGTPSEATQAADADIVFPDVGDWANYCDSVLKHRRAQLGNLGNKLTQQGFFEIDQLTRDRISHSDLAQSLEIGVGIAALIVRYAEEDVARIQAGNFHMDSV